MENEYGITVTNKYSLFLSGDEDLLQVLQRELESKPASKKEKQKKAPGKEKDVKLPQSTQSGNEQPKVESVDQFTSPTSGDGMYVRRVWRVWVKCGHQIARCNTYNMAGMGTRR